MTVLVVGDAPVDAGKTTFALGLVERTDATGYKPRAGNDFWYDHDDVRRAVDRGRLYGKDAAALAAASPGEHDPEDVNPVHRLWRPKPAGGSGLLGRDDREFLVDRVDDRYVVNGTVDLPPLVRSALPLGDARVVTSLPECNDSMSDLHLPAQQRVRETVREADRAVVESYADVARPFPDSDPDAVAVVDAGRARLFDGPRYVKACEVATGGHDVGQLEERVPDVTGLLDPKTTVSLPPLTADERTDPGAVADAYGAAYDAVRSVAAE